MTPRSHRYGYPLKTAGSSVVTFFAGFLFFEPAICGGPGLLGLDYAWSAFLGMGLFLAGFLGLCVAVVWLIAVFFLRAGRKHRFI